MPYFRSKSGSARRGFLSASSRVGRGLLSGRVNPRGGGGTGVRLGAACAGTLPAGTLVEVDAVVPLVDLGTGLVDDGMLRWRILAESDIARV